MIELKRAVHSHMDVLGCSRIGGSVNVRTTDGGSSLIAQRPRLDSKLLMAARNDRQTGTTNHPYPILRTTTHPAQRPLDLM